MSWEETGETRLSCLCGRGVICQRHYTDDWNRTLDGPVFIDCEECKSKYSVESESHQSCHPGHGSTTTYYLTPIDYPAYAGVREVVVFGALKTIRETSFSNYLIERYSLSDLLLASAEYIRKQCSSKVVGVAALICKERKKSSLSVKSSIVVQALDDAIAQYNSYHGSYDQRILVRKREKVETKAYLQKKRKSQIRLEL